jgi:hypothetical protein
MSVTVLEVFSAKTNCPIPFTPPGTALYDSFTPAISASEYLGLPPPAFIKLSVFGSRQDSSFML